MKTMCPPRLSPQWLCGNSCTWTHDVHQVHELPQSHCVPKYMSCRKAIVVITGRAHCFHDWICITPVLLL